MPFNTLPKRFWWFYHIGMLLFSVTAALVIKYPLHGEGYASNLVISFLTVFGTSVCIGYLVIWMTKKAGKLSLDELRKRILPALLFFYLAAFLIANIAVSLGVLGWFLVEERELTTFWPHLLENQLMVTNIQSGIWLMFFSVTFFYILWQKSAKREQRLITENLKYRYSTLKAQVNPHFLFNSLNILSEMNREDSEVYIQKLSGIYRYLLENEEADLVPLDQELQFAKKYFDLHHERDGEKIALEIDIRNPTQFQIIPLSLQILIENALKHNTRSLSSPLHIRMTMEDDYIVVANNIQRKTSMENSTRIGLSNLKERVKLSMNRELIIRKDAGEFNVKLPVVGSRQ